MHRRFTIALFLVLGLVLSPLNAQDPEKKPDPAPAAAEDTISVETNLVVLNVTISDLKDRYVPDLKSADFRILEDGKQQEILSFSFEETPFAAAILLDASASMQHKLTLGRAACANFVEGIREGDTFAIYTFSGTKVKKLQDFTEVRDIPDSVWDLEAEGKTPLYDAISQAADDLSQRPERRRAILLASDGGDTQSRASLDQAIKKAIAANAMIYAIDMTDSTVYHTNLREQSAEVMKSMAQKTGGRFFRTPGGAKLREAFANAVTELRNQYTLTYESSNDRLDGRWRAIEVRVARPQLNIRTKQGYYARKKGKR
jgi:Ca-activated chloride channel family protein